MVIGFGLLLFQLCSLICTDIVSKEASRGDRVILTCNQSVTNMTQVNWASDKYSYAFITNGNKHVSNFSLNRFSIDPNIPPTLSILDFQDNDTGLYKCTLNDERGTVTLQWNLTLTEKPITKDIYFIYILITVSGLLLVTVTSAVCLQRIRSRSSHHHTGQRQGERPQDGTDEWASSQPQSQYFERLNSIYQIYRWGSTLDKNICTTKHDAPIIEFLSQKYS